MTHVHGALKNTHNELNGNKETKEKNARAHGQETCANAYQP